MERWEKLAGIRCPVCGGAKTKRAGVPYDDRTVEFVPCQDCQGAGRWAWELTVECPDKECAEKGGKILWTFDGGDTRDIDHEDCKGSSRILKSGDSLLVAAEAVLDRIWGHWWMEKLSDGRYVYGRNWEEMYEPASVRLAAAALALETLVPKS